MLKLIRTVSGIIPGWVTLVFILALTGCQDEKEHVADTQVQFSVGSISTPGTDDGRRKDQFTPQGVIITIRDNHGNIVVDQKTLDLHQFGESYLSVPVTLSATAGRFFLTEFFVIDEDQNVRYATPREGSALAHLVTDPLDMGFAVSKDQITTVTPEVVEVDDNASPEDYGYGQFGFSIVNKIDVVISSFIKGQSNFELTASHLKIEGLNDESSSTPLWVYEKDLEAKANTLVIREAHAYRITATKQGYKNWTETVSLADEDKVEIIFEDGDGLEFETIWNKHYGGSDGDFVRRSIATADGGVLLVGQTTSTDYDVPGPREGTSDAWVLKLDGSGAKEWSKTYSYSIHDRGTSATEFSDGSGFLITGHSSDGTNHNADLGWVLKINTEGEVIWEKKLPGYGSEVVASAEAVTGPNNFVVFATASYAPHFGHIVRQMDSNGNTVWEKTFPSNKNFNEDMKVKRAGNSYLLVNCGQWYAQSVYKMNAQGEIEWEGKLATTEEYQFNVTAPLPDGYLVAGEERYMTTVNGSLTSRYKVITAKFSESGVLVWKKDIDMPGRKFLDIIDITPTASGNFLVAGDATTIENPNARDAWIAEINPQGERIAERYLDGTASEHHYSMFWSVVPLNNNEYVVAGTANNYGKDIPGNYGYDDAWVMRIRF